MSAPPERASAVRRGPAYDWVSEATLASVTVVVAVGMSRLFTDWSYLREVLALVLVTHVIGAAARRAGLSTLSGALLCGGSLVLTVTMLLYPESAWLVLPTGATFGAARDHLTEAWNVVNASPSPVAPAPGLVLCAGAALSLCAFLADTTAFRMRAAVTAVVPASAVFGFTVAAGTGDGAVGHGALFSAAVGASMVSLWLRNRRVEPWIESGPGRGALAMARAGCSALVLAVVAGAAAGPWLPGADAEPWIDLARLEVTDAAPWVDRPTPDPEPWADFAVPPDEGSSSDGTGTAAPDGPRVLVSPLVQVRSRLVELSDRELFTVAVLPEERQYWRLTSLDEFDGNGWRARSDYADASGTLASTVDPSIAGPSFVHTVSLLGLGNSYLPVAYEARRVIDDGGVAMEYESASGSAHQVAPGRAGGTRPVQLHGGVGDPGDRRPRPAPRCGHVGPRLRLPGVEHPASRRGARRGP